MQLIYEDEKQQVFQDIEKQQDIVIYKNSNIKKVTFEYEGVHTWEYALSQIIINYMEREKLID